MPPSPPGLGSSRGGILPSDHIHLLPVPPGPATQGREGHPASPCPSGARPPPSMGPSQGRASEPPRRSLRPALRSSFPRALLPLTRWVGSVEAVSEVCGHRLWLFLKGSGAGGLTQSPPSHTEATAPHPRLHTQMALPPPGHLSCHPLPVLASHLK